jgi:hypothetical protein
VSLPEGLWKPGTVTILDERLTDTEAYLRRQEIERLMQQLTFVLADPEGAAR